MSCGQPPMPLPDGGGGQGTPLPPPPHVPPKPPPGPATEDHNQNSVLKPAGAAAGRDSKQHEPQRLSHEQVRPLSGPG